MIYTLLVLVILVMRRSLNSITDLTIRQKRENIFCLIICSIIVLLAAFRSDSVGADTSGYREFYNNIGDVSNDTIMHSHLSRYWGYYLPCKIFSLTELPVEVWFALVQTIYMLAIMAFINKFSKDRLFSLLVFVCIGLFTFSMAGLKQVMSMSFMTFAFILFINNKHIYSVLLIWLCYHTHPASFIFLPAFLLYRMRNSKYLIHLTLISIVFVSIMGFDFLYLLVDIWGDEHYEMYLEYEHYAYTTFIFYIVTFAIAFFIRYQYMAEEGGRARIVIALSLMGVGIQLLANLSANMFRLAYLYTPFMMIMYPNVCAYNKTQNSIFTKVILYVCLIFYFLYTERNEGYSFY